MTNPSDPKNIVILGANGMLGNGLARVLVEANLPVTLLLRKAREMPSVIHSTASVLKMNQASDMIGYLRVKKPDIVINCIGVIKQSGNMMNRVETIEINTLFPHRLAEACREVGSRLIHFSSDCVFTGRKGATYEMSDTPDATDLYGRSKLLGEVDYGNALTLRTSIIGRQPNRALSLIDWYFSQTKPVKGYRRAVFSGLPVNEIGTFLVKYIIPNPSILGLYNLSAAPINKFELLKLVQHYFDSGPDIIADDNLVINRSLSSETLRKITGYNPPGWSELIEEMSRFYKKDSK